MIKPALIEPPTADPVSLADVKTHLRVDHADDDELLNVLIAAATDHLDGYGGVLGKCLMRQKWRISAERFVFQHIRLPFREVVSVEVKYFNKAEQEVTVAPSDYELLEDSIGPYVCLSPAFPETELSNAQDPAWIEMTLGAETVADLPASIVVAIKMMIAHWYEQRSGEGQSRGLPPGVEAVLSAHRKVRM